MDGYDDDIEMSIESEDDERIIMTFVSLSGKKITPAEFILKLEIYLADVAEAEEERMNLRAVNQ